MDLKEQEVLGDRVGTHWYYSSKAGAMRTYLGKRHYQHVIDIGAGSGFFWKYLLAEGSTDRATCVDTGYDHDWSETVAGRPIDYVRTYEGHDADLFLFMDVLEHVPDDVTLLKQYVDGAPPQAEVSRK